MTVFTSTQRPPTWCELESFAIVTLQLDEAVRHSPATRAERLLCTNGTVQIHRGSRSLRIKPAQFLDIDPADGEWVATGTTAGAQFVRLSGHWGDDLGGCGIFAVARSDEPNGGDPVTYPKHTRIDRHYHDCDEYWIVLSGAGETVVDDRHLPVRPGDCLAIGTGHHHDFPLIESEVKAVFFETTLTGRKRVGHLWDHTHGTAHPVPGRV
jgi:mannose-6-phosphate isomerase-like protein (cupin superfamily)